MTLLRFSIQRALHLEKLQAFTFIHQMIKETLIFLIKNSICFIYAKIVSVKSQIKC